MFVPNNQFNSKKLYSISFQIIIFNSLLFLGLPWVSKNSKFANFQNFRKSKNLGLKNI